MSTTMSTWWNRAQKFWLTPQRPRPYRRPALLLEALEVRDVPNGSPASHVLILSVDGLHQADITDPSLAGALTSVHAIQRGGVSYTDASTTSPSDSFPGTLSYLTGAGPGTTGVFYDDSYSRTLRAPGSASNTPPGTEVAYFENLDKNSALLSGGGNFDASSIDPAQLPINPATNQVVYPNQFLQTNTIFDIAHQAGLYTAFSDKHPAYQIANGPIPTAINDFYAPEINSTTALLDNATGKTVNADSLLNDATAPAQGLTIATGYTASVFAAGPGGATQPDSITVDGLNVYVGYQNGAAKDGSSGASTIAQFTPTGAGGTWAVVRTWSIPGHNDGLKVDPTTHKVWAIQNEDANPALVVIDPTSGTTIRYTIASVNGGGGFDDIAFVGGKVFMTASNPANNPNTDPAVVQVTLDDTTHTAHTTPVLSGNAAALNLVTHRAATLNLQDPDSMTVDPHGDLVLTSQADNELVTVLDPGTPKQSVTVLPLSDAAKTPVSVDDTLFNRGAVGEMLLTDQKTGTIYQVTVPAGSSARAYSAAQDIGELGTTNLNTGLFTPVISGLGSPRGLALLNAGAFADLGGYTLVDPSTDPMGPNDPNLINDTTKNVLLTEKYDDLKVAAILKEIDGKKSHDFYSTVAPEIPALFGMNFQAVSVAQKDAHGGITLLPNGQEGAPSALLEGALQHTDASIGAIVAELKKRGLWNSTELYVTAKHGQDPRVGLGGLIKDNALTDVLAAAKVDVAQATQDDVSLIWLQNQKQTFEAVADLQAFKAGGTVKVVFQGVPQTLPAGQVIDKIIADTSNADASPQSYHLGNPAKDSTTPDVIVTLKPGYILVGNTSNPHKRAEHGGFSPDDTHVPLIVGGGALPGAVRGTTVTTPVTTKQIAVSVLNALGLDAARLQGAVIEGTRGLPGLGLSQHQVAHFPSKKADQQLVGAFYDARTTDDLGDYKVTIHFGDGAGKKTRDVFLVRDTANPHIVYIYASHKYHKAGTYDGTITVVDPSGETSDLSFTAVAAG